MSDEERPKFKIIDNLAFTYVRDKKPIFPHELFKRTKRYGDVVHTFFFISYKNPKDNSPIMDRDKYLVSFVDGETPVVNEDGEEIGKVIDLVDKIKKSRIYFTFIPSKKKRGMHRYALVIAGAIQES
jgi:rRNA processing protein Gar1